MIVLTFAHKGEARAFISRKHTLPVDFYFAGLYRDADELLLITGEGAEQASERLASVCSYFGSMIQAVLNLGIAGGLNPELELNQIYGIRRIIHEFEKDQYICASRRADRICITTAQSVREDRAAEQLRIRGADCVDMEAWGQAALCSSLQLPFQTYKLISDRAGAGTNMDDMVKQASVFSRHLFDFYKKLDYTFLFKS